MKTNFPQSFFHKENFLRESSVDRGESLNNLPPRSYSRYDDRYYGREDPAAAAYAGDNRNTNNYNSYRGNGKRMKALFSPNRHPSRFVDPLNVYFPPDMLK